MTKRNIYILRDKGKYGGKLNNDQAKNEFSKIVRQNFIFWIFSKNL